MISNQLVISKENHAARVAFSETALVRNHDDRHGGRFVELSNEVRDFRAGLLSKCPGFFGQQSSLLLAAVKFGRAMSRSRTQTYVTPTPAGTITKASSASTD